METIDLKKQIIDGQFISNFYIISGDNPKVERVYIDKIAEIAGKPLRFVDTVAELYKKSSSLFSVNYCYVCMDDTDFMSTEKAWETVQSAIGSNMLILWVSNIDKRGKFYKRFKDDIYFFEPLHSEVLKSHLLDDVELSENECDELAQLCGGDYGRCLLEVDKIKAYAERCSISESQAYDKLVTDGLIYEELGNCAFDFADAVVSGNITGAFNGLGRCIANGESILGMLSLVYNRFKMMLQVQSCKSSDIENSTGLSGWEVRMAKNLMGAYSISELVYALKLIRNVELGYKKGQIEEDFIFPFLLVKILS